MPIGSSSGQYFQDQGDLLIDQYGPMSEKQKSDRKEIDANTTSGDFRSRFGGAEERPLVYISPTMPPGGSTEVTGALKSSGGGNVPQNTPTQDYDYDAWKAANPGVEMAPGQHYPDTYKLPNHMTFSDESQYHGQNDEQGGHWNKRDDGTWDFTPGVSNLRYHSMDEMKYYFKQVEPGNTLNPPNIDDVLKAKELSEKDNQPKPNVLFHTKAGDITDQDIDKGMGLAMSFSGGGLTFAGVKSAGMKERLADLGHAQVLEANGVHPDVVHNQTGFFRGTDSRWRYEIDDSKSSFDRNWTDGGTTAKLPDVLTHPELYKAYPQLKDVIVRYDSKLKDAGAYWDAGNKQVVVGPGYKSDQGTLMHEIQHAIQDYEGFAKGGSAMTADVDYALKYGKYNKQFRESMLEFQDLFKKSTDEGLNPAEEQRYGHLANILTTYNQYAKAANEKAAEYYVRLAGEVEARNTDARLLLSEKDRRLLTPTATEDLSRQHQILVENVSGTTAYGAKDPITGAIAKSEPTQFRRAANDNKKLQIDDPERDSFIEDAWSKMIQKSKILEEMSALNMKGKLSEFDKARYEKLKKQHDEL